MLDSGQSKEEESVIHIYPVFTQSVVRQQSSRNKDLKKTTATIALTVARKRFLLYRGSRTVMKPEK